MKNTYKNIRIIADAHGTDGSFNILLDFSGKREYLITHRFRPDLYAVLKNGITLREWNRIKPWKPHSAVWNGRKARQSENVFRHLNAIINDYLLYRDDAPLTGKYQNNTARVSDFPAGRAA